MLNLRVYSVIALLTGCGVGQADPTVELGEARQEIYGGTSVPNGSHPGVAQLHTGVPSSASFRCTGTLVTPSWVLTAANCLIDSANGGIPYVTVGDHELGKGDIISVKRAIRHSNYSCLDYDVALLQLATPSTRPVVKLAQAQDMTSVSAGTSSTVAAYGETETALVSNNLRSADVSIVSQTDCEQKYPNISARHICAGDGLPSDACLNDSGGPLFTTIAGVETQIGLVHRVNRCPHTGLPTVYMRVSEFHEWIFATIADYEYRDANCVPQCIADYYDCMDWGDLPLSCNAAYSACLKSCGYVKPVKKAVF